MSMNPGQTTKPAGTAIGVAPFDRQIGADGRDLAIFDPHIDGAVDALRRVDHTSAVQDDGPRCHGRASSTSRPASR